MPRRGIVPFALTRRPPCPMVPPAMPQPAPPDGAAIAAEILRQTAARGPEGSICPSEVARALAGGAEADPWRPLLGRVRDAALRLAREGRIEILRKGKPVTPEEVRGVVRLRSVPGGKDA
jgi:Protein of unknown function (DUF3253)